MSDKLAARDLRTQYDGGKNGEGVYQRIINIIPPHDVFIEACAGSAAITRMIKPAKSTLLIEIDIAQSEILRVQLQDRAAIYSGNFLDCAYFKNMAAPASTFIFIDPPYMKQVRSCSRNIYNHEWDQADHVAFLNWLHCSEARHCMLMLTHPRCLIYQRLLKDWTTIDFRYHTRGGWRDDCIWINYRMPKLLHDYRYVGETRTKRQVIDRRTKRLIDKLAALPDIERNATIAAINEKFK